MAFSKKLKGLREAKGLSQEELATKLKIPRSSITHYENSDDRLPRKTRLLEIANFFGVSIDFLLSDVNEEPRLNEKNEKNVTPRNLQSNEVNNNNLDKTINDPNLGLWFKDIQDASPEKQDELKQFWEFIKEKEKNRKPEDKQ
ncbi:MULTISPECIES: helix-turn-helix domain-containing protein [Bacillus cereus group]|uniref:helix-turn-helix domain-containing protein n=1 Tax=Bacillus cereus group TaxID=86661 RepID=UPI0018F6DDF9|nr:helix-turn-helix transcriptional regulator [Bacillus cereus]MBJ8037039.1 helix-turn-helix transcriptional regulator [Bacillus cereus]